MTDDDVSQQVPVGVGSGGGVKFIYSLRKAGRIFLFTGSGVRRCHQFAFQQLETGTGRSLLLLGRFPHYDVHNT
jgi:hypothetical protein